MWKVESADTSDEAGDETLAAEAQMKRFNDPPKHFVSAEEWYLLACAEFPELELKSFDADVLVWSACEGLAYAVDAAHREPENTAFLTRCYGLIRWSIRHTHDAQLKGWIGDWFFGELLRLPHSKTVLITWTGATSKCSPRPSPLSRCFRMRAISHTFAACRRSAGRGMKSLNLQPNPEV
jgi:hypothetical protein